MVLKNTQLETRKLSREILKEISVLHDLGVSDYEIEYLIHLRDKLEAKQKWQE